MHRRGCEMRSVAPMKAMIPHQGDATIRRLRVDDMFIASLEFLGSHHFLWTHLSRLISGLSDRIHGAPFCLFHESGGRNQRIECCIPVRPFSGNDEIRTRMLPGASMLTWVHHGPYQAIGESWEQLFDYIESRNIRTNGPRREVYLGVHSADGRIMSAELQVPLLDIDEFDLLQNFI